MADFARAMSTPPPGTPPAAPGQAQDDHVAQQKREAKSERDRLRRKAQRMAALQVVAKPKKKKAKKKKPTDIYDAMKAQAARNPAKKRVVGKSPALAAPYGKKRRRGRPPGAKNKPKLGLAVALVPAPGVLPRTRVTAALLADNSLLARIQQAVALLIAMPEHARKVVLDAVK